MENGEWKATSDPSRRGGSTPSRTPTSTCTMASTSGQSPSRTKGPVGDKTIIVQLTTSSVANARRTRSPRNATSRSVWVSCARRHPDDAPLEFGRSATAHRRARGERRPETFDFLGFTHYCRKTRRLASVWGANRLRSGSHVALKRLKDDSRCGCTKTSTRRRNGWGSGQRLAELLRRSDQLPDPWRLRTAS